MINAGRWLTLLGIVGFIVTASLSVGELREAVNASSGATLAVNVLGAVGALGVFGAWVLALYHWGTRFDGTPASKRRWGVGLTLGAFVGAWLYWLTRQQNGLASP